MTGELLHKLITTKGKRVVYKYTQQESYFYDSSKYMIELYYDWNKEPSRGIRIFSLQSENKFTILHQIKGHSEIALCNQMSDFLNETSNLWNILMHKEMT
jgi:hypothetical protein